METLSKENQQLQVEIKIHYLEFSKMIEEGKKKKLEEIQKYEEGKNKVTERRTVSLLPNNL